MTQIYIIIGLVVLILMVILISQYIEYRALRKKPVARRPVKPKPIPQEVLPFNLSDYTKSMTAERNGIDNSIKNSSIESSLRCVHKRIVCAIWRKFGSVHINSGYRCLALNRLLGSKDSSQHRKGEAVDIEVPGVSNKALFDWCRKNLKYDQLILEFHDMKIPSSGWVHCSTKSNKLFNRKQSFGIDRHGKVFYIPK